MRTLLCLLLLCSTAFGQTKLMAPDPASHDEFGASVAILGNVAVCGSWLDDNKGSAYVFRDGVFEAKLAPPDRGQYDFFGVSVAISGTTIVVGSYSHSPNGLTQAGAAYVFKYNGSTWPQVQKLTASDAGAGDFFGIGVGIDGDTIVVGAFSDDDGGNAAGAAYVFKLAGSTWTQQAKLKASDAAASDTFGWSVDVSGDTIVVGSKFDDVVGQDSGSAYIFKFNGMAWQQEAKLVPNDGAEKDYFAWALALDGNTALIGSQEDSTGTMLRHGSAYVFTRSGITWTQTQKLMAVDKAMGDKFGHAVSIDGDTLIVGAYWDDFASGLQYADYGSAYVFTKPAATWNQTLKLTEPGGGYPQDYFGNAVSVSGDALLIGVYRDSQGFFNNGAAYYWPGSPPTGCNPPDCDDANPCTNDACVSNVCQHTNNTAACPDDGNACTNDVCTGGNCTHPAKPAGTSCNDGLFCNGADTCQSGSCSGHAGNPCPAGQTCNESTNTCASTGCQPPDCSDGNDCTIDSCVNNVCQHAQKPDGSTCGASCLCFSGVCLTPCGG